MSNYRKGTRLEYELASRLWEDGWAVFRQASSGGVSHPSADVIAVKKGRVLIFECKNDDNFPINVSKDKKQLEEIRKRSFPKTSLHNEGRFEEHGDCLYAFKKHGMLHVTSWSREVITEDTPCKPYFKLIE